jgi:hypothetical protein
MNTDGFLPATDGASGNIRAFCRFLLGEAASLDIPDDLERGEFFR